MTTLSKPHISPDRKVMIVDNSTETSEGGLYIFDINSTNIKQRKKFPDLAVNFHSWIDSSNARMEEDYSPDPEKPNNFILHFDKVTKDWVLQPTSEIFAATRK